MIKAAYALVYGTDDLLDLYHIPGGTIWNVPALLSVFFEEGCYYTVRFLRMLISDQDLRF